MMKRLRRLPIALQLSITAATGVILFSVALAALSSSLIARQLREAAVADAKLQTEQFAERAVFAFLVADPSVPNDAVIAMTAFPAIDQAMLVRANGEVLAHSGSGGIAASRASARHLTDVVDAGDSWVVSAPVLSHAAPPGFAVGGTDAEYLGTAILAFSKAPLARTIETIRLINIIAGVIAAALLILLLSIQIRAVTGPLRSLSDLMSNGDRQDSRRQARVAGSKEMRDIAQVYNALMEAVEGAQAALQTEVDIRTSELKAARDAALAANKQKSEIMAAVTHEMKMPLQSIMGYAQLTLEALEFALDGDAAIKSREQVVGIHERASELHLRITQMLDLAQAEAGKHEIKFAEVDVSALLEATVKSVVPLAAKRENKIVTEFDCAGVIWIDEDKLHQIVVNLLTNACKFTKSGRITLRCKRSPLCLLIEVDDTGVGIAESDIDLIFEPFRQVDMGTKREFGGTGLGLAVTREFVKLLGGEISVRSQPNAGSTFSVKIPLPISRFVSASA